MQPNKETIIDETNKNGIIYRKTTSNAINKSYLTMVMVWIAVISWITFGNTPPLNDDELKLKECQEKFMKAENVIHRYNEEYKDYKVELPKNTCVKNNIISSSDSIVKEINEKNYLDSLHNKVCEKQINSPLCRDRKLFDRLYQLTEERLPMKQFYPILLGITNAESSLGLDFAKDNLWGTCFGRNNWGWTKYQIHDDNTRSYKRELNWFNYTYNKALKLHNDQFGCNLYPFKDIEEFWITKVNWMRFGYKGCVDSKTPLRCLSYKYVGDPDVPEQSWINNASIFL